MCRQWCPRRLWRRERKRGLPYKFLLCPYFLSQLSPWYIFTISRQQWVRWWLHNAYKVIMWCNVRGCVSIRSTEREKSIRLLKVALLTRFHSFRPPCIPLVRPFSNSSPLHWNSTRLTHMVVLPHIALFKISPLKSQSIQICTLLKIYSIEGFEVGSVSKRSK